MNSRLASRRMPTALLALTLFAGTTFAAPPGVRHVRAEAAAGGDGLTWATAYNDLRQALLTAGSSGGSITELWVKKGTYLPGPAGSTDRMQTFTLVADVGVYGGFAGTETDREQRHPTANPTTLSGQLAPGRYVYNVVVGGGNSGAILDGFTITFGMADNESLLRTRTGAGMHITGSPTIRGCTITTNNLGEVSRITITVPPARLGGGVYCAPGSNASFIDCVIENNVSNDSQFTTGGEGGGLAAENCSVTLRGCRIRDNYTGTGRYGASCTGGVPYGRADGGPGAGLYFNSAAALIDGCVIYGNVTGHGESGVTCGWGPNVGRSGGNGPVGVYSTDSTVVILNTLIARNRTGNGGAGAATAIAAAGGGNGGKGAGVWASGGAVELINCTVTGQILGDGGPGGVPDLWTPGPDGVRGTGAGLTGDASTHARNSIFWNDTSEIVGPVGISYSTVRGGFAGAGNIAADPQFVSLGGPGDYRPQPASPCIDAGNSLVDIDPSTPGTQPLPSTDLAGLTRRVDIASVMDTGLGAPVVDMGAYEVQSCIVDLNGDGIVDFSDYLEFLNLFDAGDLRVDFTGDGIVDFSDYLEFLNLFDAGC